MPLYTSHSQYPYTSLIHNAPLHLQFAIPLYTSLHLPFSMPLFTSHSQYPSTFLIDNTPLHLPFTIPLLTSRVFVYSFTIPLYNSYWLLVMTVVCGIDTPVTHSQYPSTSLIHNAPLHLPCLSGFIHNAAISSHSQCPSLSPMSFWTHPQCPLHCPIHNTPRHLPRLSGLIHNTALYSHSQ